jgi:DNA repair protein RecO (recombination protein O)
MYAKYQTDALVLGTAPQGEADTRVTLFTREFGLIRARASAARKESSRMRYGLQSYMHSRVSLVRGASGWRAAGAVAETSLRPSCHEARASFARIARLTIRLVPGEEKNENLFSLLQSAHAALNEATAEQCTLMELVCVARVLHTLGYLSNDALGAAHAAHSLFSTEVLTSASNTRDELLASVNRALTETHL